MRKIWLHLAALAALPLTGCVSPYAPPAAGPTASVQVTMNNRLGPGFFNIIPPKNKLFGEKRIMKSKVSQASATAGARVAAGQLDLFYFLETTPDTNDYCGLPFSFSPVAGGSYTIYLGDVPPPQPTNFVGKIGHFFHPDLGGACFADVRQLLADGQAVKIPVTRWHP